MLLSLELDNYSLMQKRILLLITILFFLQVAHVFAEDQNLNLPLTGITPDSLYYPLQRAWEKVREKLAFSNEAKIGYARSLLRVRLVELKFVVDNQFLSEVQHSSERFAYQAGVLTEDLLKQNKNKQKSIEEFGQYSKFLEPLRDKYPANSSFWMLIQHDINTLKILSDRLSK